jgi:acyl carrier protein
MEVEDEFVIEIPDNEAYNFNTVGELVTYISHHPSAK